MYVDGIRPIVTDGLCGLSVCHDRQPCKTAEPIEMPFGYGLWLAQGALLDRGSDPHAKGQFSLGKERPIVKYRDSMP